MRATLNIDAEGTLRFVYADELRPLLDLGDAVIDRASHVEPDAAARWSADLAPSAGPVLGPFERRDDAIAAEVEWLEGRLGSLR